MERLFQSSQEGGNDETRILFATGLEEDPDGVSDGNTGEILGLVKSGCGVEKGLEEGAWDHQSESLRPSFSFCLDLSPSSSARQQHSSFSPAAPSSGCGPAFPCCPHPAPPGCPGAHLQLPLS